MGFFFLSSLFRRYIGLTFEVFRFRTAVKRAVAGPAGYISELLQLGDDLPPAAVSDAGKRRIRTDRPRIWSHYTMFLYFSKC